MDNFNIGIYKITSPTNRVYIGQSWDIEKRHRSYKNLNCKSQTKLYNSLCAHGWENHNVEVVLYLDENTTQELMDYWEVFFVKYFKELGHDLLNLKEGGKGGGKASPELRQKMREIQLGKKHSEETKKKMSAVHSGVKKTKQHAENIAKAKIGKKLSDEHRAAVGRASKGRTQSLETLIKRRVLGNTWQSVKVNQYTKDGEFIKEWESMTVAAKALGIRFKGISKCCAGGCKSYMNYVWRKAEPKTVTE